MRTINCTTGYDSADEGMIICPSVGIQICVNALKGMKDIPPEFEQVFEDNFWDLLA